MPQPDSLDWIQTQRDVMVDTLIKWTAINSSSDNLLGLAHLLAVLKKEFSILRGKIETIPLSPLKTLSLSPELTINPVGQLLRITKRPKAQIQILFGGHMDTVYSLRNPFQTAFKSEANILKGPGVADMKGGLLIMLKALEALEKHPAAANIGWEILINPDEEIGSTSSQPLFKRAARNHHLGLIFEPSFADGALVSSRKGSMNVAIIAKGKAAHAGRDFDKGRNAILAIADFIVKANLLNNKEKGISINPGNIAGGGPINIVPELAMCRLNARAVDPEDFATIQKNLQKIIDKQTIEGVELLLVVEQSRVPKLFDEKSHRLFEMLDACAKEEGYRLFHRASGGVCDGNSLAAEGLPVIDSLGAIGGEIHTSSEYLLIDSLVQRSRLVARFLIKLATGSLSPTP